MFRKSALVIALCSSSVAWAGDEPLYQQAPAWVSPAPLPDAASRTEASPSVVVYDQQSRISDGQVWAYIDQATRVASPQSLNEMGTVTLSWQPDSGDLIVHRAEILRGGERIDLIAQGQTFEVLRREEQLEQLMIDGTLTATLTVEGLRVGDILRITHSTTDRDKTLKGNAQAAVGLIAAPTRAGFARARLSWPEREKLNWRYHADGDAPQAVRRGGFETVEVALPLAKPVELPADAPMRYRKLQMIEASSFADWQAVSRTMAPLYRAEGLIPAGSPLAAEVAKIAAKSTDPRERAALALRLVQDEVRYLYRGMDGGNYTPQTPADSWSRRYGDCKAKTLLLLALLHELGIEAEAVVVNSTGGDLVPTRLPSAGAFDHVIVRAMVDGKALWLDGTGSGTRLADIEDVPPFRNVLPLRVAGAALEAVPLQAPARAMIDSLIEFDQRTGIALPALFSFTIVARGPMAETIRASLVDADKDRLDGIAQGIVNGAFGDALLSGRTLTYDAESATAKIVATGIISSPWRRRDGRYRMLLDRGIGQIDFAPDRARASWKDIPVATAPGPFRAVTRQRVRLPTGEAAFTLEGNRVFEAPLAGVILDRSVTMANGVIAVDDIGTGAAVEIPANQLSEARAQIALAKRRPLEAVAPTEVQPRWKLALDADKSTFAPLLAAYAKAIERDDEPDAVLGYFNRASFNAGIYDYRGALLDLDRILAKQPSAPYHLWRAQLRRFVGDAKGARADAEAGLALDPESLQGIGLLSALRFEAGEHDAAIAMLDERIDAGGKDKLAFQTAKAELLGEAGRVDEGKAIHEDVIRDNPGNPTALNARCWYRGTMNVELDGALKDCTRAIELAEQSAPMLDSRALVYLRMGRMDEALADIEAGLKQSPEMATSLFMRAVIRKQRGEAAAEDLAAARLIDPQIDRRFGKWGIKP